MTQGASPKLRQNTASAYNALACSGLLLLFVAASSSVASSHFRPSLRWPLTHQKCHTEVESRKAVSTSPFFSDQESAARRLSCSVSSRLNHSSWSDWCNC